MPALQGLSIGQELDLGSRFCTLAKFRLYSGSKGPNHHTDYQEAAKIGLSRPLAPGVMLVAYMYEALTNIYGAGWFSGGVLDVSFVKPVWVNETVHLRAKVTDVSSDILGLSVTIENQDGVTVLAGSARGPYPSGGV